MDEYSKKTKAYLQPAGWELKSILLKVKELNRLEQLLTQYLDKPIRDYVKVGNISGNCLNLIVANGSIASQLRFQCPDLLAKFARDHKLSHIKNIQCQVRLLTMPTVESTSKAQAKIPLLSAASAKAIYDIASSLSDPKLRAIMERIASHNEKEV